METARKIIVEVPQELLEKAQRARSFGRCGHALRKFLRSWRIGVTLSCTVILLLAGPARGVDGSAAQMHWIASWTASQQLVEPSNSLAPTDIRDATLRQIVRLSLGGSEIRLRLSNRFGTTPLHLTAAVHVARAASPTSDRMSLSLVTIPPFSKIPGACLLTEGVSRGQAITVDCSDFLGTALILQCSTTESTIGRYRPSARPAPAWPQGVDNFPEGYFLVKLEGDRK